MLTPKELAVMECLWNQSPLSCSELLENKEIHSSEKSTYEILTNLQKKNMIEITDTRKGNRKPFKLYAPTISAVEYMAMLVKSAPTYNDCMLPALFCQLIGGKVTNKTQNQITEIIEKARSESK